MPLSAFAQFVKDEYHGAAAKHPGHTAPEYMQWLASYYRKAYDIIPNKPAPRKPRQKQGARSCTKSFSAKCERKGKSCKVNAKRRSCVRSPSPKRSPIAALAFRVRRSPSRK